MSITELLIQYGYLTHEQYSYAYQLQQQEPIELRKPLLQIYLEQGFLGLEHIEYCLSIRKQYIEQGYNLGTSIFQNQQTNVNQYPDATESYQQSTPMSIKCKVCLSDCQSNWAACPFCGNSLS